jgi:hypothetical protein
LISFKIWLLPEPFLPTKIANGGIDFQVLFFKKSVLKVISFKNSWG